MASQWIMVVLHPVEVAQILFFQHAQLQRQLWQIKKSVILCMHGFVLLLHMLMYLALKSDEILVFQERGAQFRLLHLNRTLLHFPLNANHLST